MRKMPSFATARILGSNGCIYRTVLYGKGMEGERHIPEKDAIIGDGEDSWE
jgi:hypothetical protein